MELTQVITCQAAAAEKLNIKFIRNCNGLVWGWEGEGGHYGLTGRIIKNLKMPKKLRQGAQNSGKITSNLELIKLFTIHSK